MKLAQLNIATARYPLDHPNIKDFVDNLDKVNAIAESSDGFVWRLQEESGNATNIKVFADPTMIVNMSVWQDIASLKNFMFQTLHRDFMARKKEWFEPLNQASYVMWWIADHHQPTLQEALERLEHLRAHGESEYAFSFKSANHKTHL